MSAPIAPSAATVTLRPSRGLFRGVRALLADRRGVLVHTPLWGGLLPALLFGLMCALASAGAPNALREIGLPTLAAACGMIPLLIGMPWTGVTQAHAPLRRDELLVLPMGRLAIPTAVLLGSLIGIAAWLVAVLVGLALTVGLGSLVAGLTEPAAADMVRLWLVASVGTFAIGTSVGAIGTSWGLSAGAWCFAPLLVLSAVRGMGYDAEAQRGYAVLWGAGLTLYYLVLPFLLYSRPAHIWTSSRQPELEAPWLFALGTAVCGTIALGLAGAGWSVVGVVAAGGALTGLARRGRPAVRGESALRLALLASIVPIAPVLVVGLAVDARGDVATADGLVPLQTLLAPDGRHVALTVEPRLAVEGGLCPRTRRVLVLDVTGERAPVVLPARFAELASGAWSSDGRFLAVEDHTLGRLRSEPTRPGWKQDVIVDPFDVIGFKVGTAVSAALLLDTHTGDVLARDAFEVAPGWTTPDDLVTITSALSGDHVLRDGAGRELVVSRSRGALRVVGYAGGRPVLTTGPHAPGVIEATFGPVAAALQRWDVAGGLVAHDPARGARWAAELPQAAGADPGRLKVTREGATRELDADVSRVFVEACDAESIVALAGESLVRIDPRDGARTVLAAGAPGAPVKLWVVDAARHQAIVMRGDAPLLVDLKTGACTPLPPAASRAIARVGDVTLVAGDRWPAVLGADGSLRALTP